jgi:2-polyprenyl-6-methoxyphenol hydroxylase-like FAD-dependent oxidoreductase
MSPVGGVGINYAIQDAVVAANLLADRLKSGQIKDADLTEVQRQREWPTRVIQRWQSLMQKLVLASAFKGQQVTNVPWLLRLFSRIPVLRDLPAKLVAFGIRRVHVDNP